MAETLTPGQVVLRNVTVAADGSLHVEPSDGKPGQITFANLSVNAVGYLVVGPTTGSPGQLVLDGVAVSADGVLQVPVSAPPVTTSSITVGKTGGIVITEKTGDESKTVFTIPAAAMKYAVEAVAKAKTAAKTWPLP